MRWTPQAGAMVCAHCGAQSSVEMPDQGPWDVTAIREQDYRAALRASRETAQEVETRVSTCPNCAARVEVSDTDHALECPFCATPVVVGSGAHRQIKPQAVLPFTLTEREAHRAMEHWLKGLWFAPNGLKKYASASRQMEGIYTPYWTYDAKTASQYRGQRGTDHTTSVSDGKGGRRSSTTTTWRRVTGQVRLAFDDLLVLASESLPKRFTDTLAPWDLTALAPYQPEFLSGFRAEAYSIDLETGMEEARARMDQAIRAAIRRDIGGDHQRIDHVDTEIWDVTFKHILLPVWVSAYRYGGKSYRFVVNGQTGKVMGERPYSAIKIAIALILAALLALGLAYVYDGYIR